jgi:arginyl-tRNA synthetase
MWFSACLLFVAHDLSLHSSALPVQVNEAEIDAAASIMGYGAVKYADLKNHRTTDYKFSFDQVY